jgi:hypothetical protein
MYKSLEWPNGLARASRQSVRVAVRIPMNTRVAILGVNLLPSLRRNLFSTPRPTKSATDNTKMPPKQHKLSFEGSSSSSDKRPREDVSPTPQYGRTESQLQLQLPSSSTLVPGLTALRTLLPPTPNSIPSSNSVKRLKCSATPFREKWTRSATQFSNKTPSSTSYKNM